MSAQLTRAVLVHRPTDYELLLRARATRGQAEFFLRSRGQDISQVEREHETIHRAIEMVLGRIPSKWRRVAVMREELNRFLFEPEDVVIAVGQDGLVANVAKYVRGQLVIGINPLPERFDGPLTRHPAAAAPDLFAAVESGRNIAVEERTMVEARLDDGQTLVALNEVFLGHRSHQSARYLIRMDEKEEHQSSSGLIACTGTGATGWAQSISRASRTPIALPTPTDPELCFLVREAWPSKSTGTGITSGRCAKGRELTIVSEMNQGGVIFGDGIEDDYLPFDWGRLAAIRVSDRHLRLVV